MGKVQSMMNKWSGVDTFPRHSASSSFLFFNIKANRVVKKLFFCDKRIFVNLF